jgi:hypothetical protein
MDTALLYHLALFTHILGAFGLIAALTLEAMVLRGLRHAVQAEDARTWLFGARVFQRLAPASLGLILIPGLYMMATAWGPKGWILVALGGLAGLVAVGGLLTGVRMARIGPAVGRASGPLGPDLQRALRDPVLLTSIRIRVALVLAIVFLMSVKPSLIISLAFVAVAAAIGLLTAQLPARRSAVAS